MKRGVSLALALMLLVAGCGRKKRKATVPAAPRAVVAMPHLGDEEVGVASWYGHPYHGRRASNGEIYDMEKMTAAHRTMPFGTIVEVRNLTNDLTTTVRIIDRGPFIDGRIIDLSHAAAKEIQMIGPGIAKVRVTVVGLPEAPPPGVFAVQIGAYKDRANAERHRSRMEELFGSARLVFHDGNPAIWRVLVGNEPTAEAAAALAERVKAEVREAFVVRVDAPAGDL